MARRPRNQVLADEVGRRLAARRHTVGLSQEKVAELAGVHRTYVGHVENGRVMPSIDVVEALCAALDVTLSELFDDIETVTRRSR